VRLRPAAAADAPRSAAPSFSAHPTNRLIRNTWNAACSTPCSDLLFSSRCVNPSSRLATSDRNTFTGPVCAVRNPNSAIRSEMILASTGPYVTAAVFSSFSSRGTACASVSAIVPTTFDCPIRRNAPAIPSASRNIAYSESFTSWNHCRIRIWPVMLFVHFASAAVDFSTLFHSDCPSGSDARNSPCSAFHTFRMMWPNCVIAARVRRRNRSIAPDCLPASAALSAHFVQP
jgi:hypothetical protein